MAPGVDLLGGVIAYVVCSLGGVAAVKALNYHFCFASWAILALLSRCTWVFAAPLHAGLVRRAGVPGWPTAKQLGLYALIAVGLSVVELLNAVSMTVLPGSLYALLKGTDVGWSMVLSRAVLGKKYTGAQVAAAGVIMAGVAAVFVGGAPPTASRHAQAAAEAAKAARIGPAGASGLCVLAAFANALLAVVTEATLKRTLKEEEAKAVAAAGASGAAPSKLLLSNAYAMWTSAMAFVMLLAGAVLSGLIWEAEAPDAACDAGSVSGNSARADGGVETSSGAPPGVWAAFVTVLALVAFTRFAERLAKHWICVRDSALTFSLVQAGRRLAAVFVLAAVFRESLPLSMVLGALVAGTGFILHWNAGRIVQSPSYDRLSPSASSDAAAASDGSTGGDTSEMAFGEEPSQPAPYL
eukprot:TRINITY_DN27859_c0_g1_i1.p1 TRINITY_DN27859_c0_g1~~TRINITY_DN27859_c0_g1_i1.p1  ORF type:complete len:411 (+),score=62.53 TRINITY_DN27859_c0_g1_i1:51-1283(+)